MHNFQFDDETVNRLEGLVMAKMKEIELTQRIVTAAQKRPPEGLQPDYNFLGRLDKQLGIYRVIYDTLTSHELYGSPPV